MRILFSSLAAYGHVYPLIPLARAARDAGHEVLFATGESVHSSITSFGLDPATAGTGVREAFVAAAGDRVRPRQMTRDQREELAGLVFGDALPRRVAADLGPVFDRFEPGLVVYGAMDFGALVAARVAGIPAVCHGFGRAAPSIAGDPTGRRAMAFAAEAGAELSADVTRGGGDPYLDIYPASLQDKDFLKTTNRIPLRPAPVSESGELPASVVSRDPGRPLVYLTLGTAFGAIPVLRQAIEGTSAADVDVLVAAGPTIDLHALGAVPDNVKVEAWVPQAALLPHVNLVVHHGGSGTTLGALTAGLPQLFLPQGADQFSNAEAVANAGAGARLGPAEQSAEAVAMQVKHLLADDETRSAAQALGAEIAAMPAAEATVPVLTGLAG